MPNIPGIENIDFTAYLSQAMYWTGIILGAAVIIAAFGAVFYYMAFQIKCDVFPLYGSSKDGIFSVGKKKKNRFKWINKNTAWRPLFPIMNRKEVEPFDSEFIYPGKQTYAFDLNGVMIPGRVNINKTEDQIRAEINPVPYYVRNWQSLTHKKNSQEFAKHTFWEDNKYFIMGLLAVLICCALCAATIWWTYKFATGGTGAVEGLTRALKDMGNIPGKPH